ncbi:MAG: hypothetical protein QW160_03835 [Candidatus Bathyarchaeia archaeon]
MTRLTPQYGSLRLFTINYATPREELLSTPITLPTSEPTDPQAVFTLQSSDFPTWSVNPYSVKYIACLYAAGRFPTAGTLYWRMVKNGASVNNGNASVSANYYYTVNAWFLDVAPGDVLGVKLWSTVSDSNYDYKAIFVYPTRFFPFPTLNYKQIYANVKIWNTDSPTLFPTLTLGNPTPWVTNYPCQGYIENGNATAWNLSLTGSFSFSCYSPHATFGLWRIWYHGDANNANAAGVQTDATYRPKYYRNYLNIKVQCRPLRLV